MTNRMTKKQHTDISFAFFGTSHIAVYVLEALTAAGFFPELIVTVPPKPKGRGLAVQPSAVEEWASTHGLAVAHDWTAFEARKWDVAIVVDYGLILPKKMLDIPARGFLNIHPSLLPRFRGASPIRSAILNDEKTTGVTIMLVTEGMDEGPVVAQKKVTPTVWPLGNAALERVLLQEGGALMAAVLPPWVAGEIEAQPQNHDLATYAEKISKEDGRLDMSGDAYKNLLKVRAFEGWPGTYALFERGGKDVRVQILDARVDGSTFVPTKVKPEGKREMSYEEFLRSGAKPAG